MAVESFSGVWSLDISNPVSTDDVSQGDEHLRGVKAAVTRTFPNVSATVSVSQIELNYLSGVGENVQSQLDTLSASAATVIARVAEISASLVGEQSRVDTLSKSLVGAQSRIDTLSQSVASLESRVDSISVNAAVAYGGYYLSAPADISTSTSLSLFTIFDAPIPTQNVTLVTANNSIQTQIAGAYYVAFSCSFSGDANTLFNVEIYKDGSPIIMGFNRYIGTGGDQGSAACFTIDSATASATYTVRIASPNDADSKAGFTKAHFFVSKLAPTP